MSGGARGWSVAAFAAHALHAQRALLVLSVLSVVNAVAAPAQARPCTTLDRLALSRRSDVRAAVDVAARPAAAEIRAVFDSARHPLRVHAGAGADDARAARALGVLEDAWDAQVAEAGFPPPLPDSDAGGDARFDVYLVPLPEAVGGLTVPEPSEAAGAGRTASAFILLDATLPDELLEVYAAHELQHALQFALDLDESLMWVEASAVFWEVRTRPDVTDWHGALPDFQGNPHAPLFASGRQLTDIAVRPAARYEYGAALFALYLDDVQGDGRGTLLREVWELAAAAAAPADPDADGAVPDANEPDFLDAMVGAGVELPAALGDFVGWRALVGPWAVPGDGPGGALPADALLGGLRLDAATLDGAQGPTEDGPYATGCVVRAVDAPANVESMPVRVDAEAIEPGRVLVLSTLVLDVDAERAVRAHTAPGAVVQAEVDVPRFATLQVAVCDVTAADPEDALAPHPVRLSIQRTDVEFPDAGVPVLDAGVAADAGDAGAEPEPPPTGCACQSSSGDPRNMRAGIGVLGLLLGAVGLGVRGYRMWKRKRLYRRD